MHRSNSAPGFNDSSMRVDLHLLASHLETGTLVPDACALLDLYRLPPKHRAELADALWCVANRIWVPHQVAKEVTEQGPAVIAAFRTHVGNRSAQRRKQFEALEHDVRSDMHELKIARSESDRAITSIKNAKNEYQETAGLRSASLRANEEQADEVTAEIARMMKGRVGSEPSAELRDRWIADSTRRLLDRRPPTVADKKKKVATRNNDCLIWHEMLRFAIENRAGEAIVLLTGDLKEDGWVEHRNGHPTGAHPLLVEEMRAAAGKPFVVITTQHLLAHTQNHRALPWATDAAWNAVSSSRLRPVRPLLPWSD